MVLSVAIADLLHSNTVCEAAANIPKFKNIITSAEPPCRKQVGCPLLDSLSVEYNKHAFERLDESLVNFLAIVCCIVVLLEVVDCTGSMAAGGTKDGTFIANEMFTQCDKIGEKFVFLMIFDGASNMQSPTIPLVLC